MSSSEHYCDCSSKSEYHQSEDHPKQRSPVLEADSRHEPKCSPFESLNLPSRNTKANNYRLPIETPSWPSSGLSGNTKLSYQEAKAHICKGALTFVGYTVRIRHATTSKHHFYVRAGTDESDEDGGCGLPSALSTMTLPLADDDPMPTVRLEQPSMVTRYGKYAGTTTLSYWVSTSASSFRLCDPKYSNAVEKDVDSSWLLPRIAALQEGLQTGECERYDFLYQYIIQDPGRFDGLEGEIKSLIAVLDAERWIDFSEKSNQIIATVFLTHDSDLACPFYHQLLLSVELIWRIYSEDLEKGKRKEIYTNLAPRVLWSLALAMKWVENVHIDQRQNEDGTSQYQLVFQNKSEQVALLKEFASEIKWPHLERVERYLDNADQERDPVDFRSAYSLSWVSGLIFPGPSAPFFLMQCLIDADETARINLARLDHLQQNVGFQYHNTTYWASDCIVGKILGATKGTKEVCGWIGPCMPTSDLGRAQLILIRQARVSHRLHIKSIRSISERTDPLGPPSNHYCVNEYVLPLPNSTIDNSTIRIEKLSFLPWMKGDIEDGPETYNAAVTFAIDGDSWPIRLRYDVSFVAAPLCHSGPHPLFLDFSYRVIRPEELLSIYVWAGSTLKLGPTFPTAAEMTLLDPDPLAEVPSQVLVVETSGNSDLEVFTRSWCSHMGLSAIVVEVEQTCIACAVRAAYAVSIAIVILRSK